MIVRLPRDSEPVENVAWPPLRVPVPSVFVPSLNVTVPVGVPAPGATALTVARKVTDWPEQDGFNEELLVVNVPALLTVCVKFAEVLVLKLESPL